MRNPNSLLVCGLSLVVFAAAAHARPPPAPVFLWPHWAMGEVVWGRVVKLKAGAFWARVEKLSASGCCQLLDLWIDMVCTTLSHLGRWPRVRSCSVWQEPECESVG